MNFNMNERVPFDERYVAGIRKGILPHRYFAKKKLIKSVEDLIAENIDEPHGLLFLHAAEKIGEVASETGSVPLTERMIDLVTVHMQNPKIHYIAENAKAILTGRTKSQINRYFRLIDENKDQLNLVGGITYGMHQVSDSWWKTRQLLKTYESDRFRRLVDILGDQTADVLACTLPIDIESVLSVAERYQSNPPVAEDVLRKIPNQNDEITRRFLEFASNNFHPAVPKAMGSVSHIAAESIELAEEVADLITEYDPEIAASMAQVLCNTKYDAQIMDLFSSYRFSVLMERFNPTVAAKIAEETGFQIRLEVEDIDGLLDLWESDKYQALMDRLVPQSGALATSYISGCFRNGKQLASKILDLFGTYKDSRSALNIAWKILNITDRDTLSNTEIGRLMEIMKLYQHNPKSACGIIIQVSKDAATAEQLMDIAEALPGFEPHVYEDYAYTLAHANISYSVTELIKREKNYLLQQTSETVFPITRIMHELGEAYVPQIKDLSSSGIRYLTQSWDIAKSNNFPLHEFYSTLREALDAGTADRWAREIVEGFHKQGEKGLLRGVVG